MKPKEWILYGAYGYTGELVVQQALTQGKRPILAGRDAVKLKEQAGKHQLPFRAFEVEDTAEHLDDVGIVINCAGPFTQTAEPMMDACLQRGIHYFDITGEIPVFKAGYKRDQAARNADVILCPGVGFDVVPTDCLAALLKEALPDATHLELAFEFGSLPSLGTIRTALRGIGAGCLIREAGKFKKVPLAHQIRKIPFPRGDLWTTSLAWGDVFTSQISTGIPNAVVYGAMPHWACRMMRFVNPIKGLLARPLAQKMLISLAKRALSNGPDETARKKIPSGFWGRVTNESGQERTATLTGPSAYPMTAELAVAIAQEVESKTDPTGGYFTASMLVGADFLPNREGYRVDLH